MALLCNENTKDTSYVNNVIENIATNFFGLIDNLKTVSSLVVVYH